MKTKQIFKSILDPIVFAAAIIALFFCGCTRTIYAPIETSVETRTNVADSTQTEKISKLIDQLQESVKSHEKVIIRDSIVYVVNEQGEVKSKEVFRDRDRDYSESETVMRITQIYDSLFQRQSARVDSIVDALRQELVPVEVEKESSFWSNFKSSIVGACIIIGVVGIFFLWRWLKSKFF